MSLPSRAARSFTLIELMVVMSIIAVLSALTLGAVGYAQKKAGRSRAQAEITAYSAALEKYKLDNGAYPSATNAIATDANGYLATGQPSTDYLANAQVLFISLSGNRTNLTDNPTAPVYIEFKANQVNTNSVPNYAKDPFGYAYGFTVGANAYFNTNFFDIWSTSGQSGLNKETNSAFWVTNWKD